VLDVVRADTPERANWRAAIGNAALGRPQSSRQIATPPLADGLAQALGRLADGAGLAGAPDADVAAIRSLRDGVQSLNRALREAPDETVRAAELAAARATEFAGALGGGARGSLREALPEAMRDYPHVAVDAATAVLVRNGRVLDREPHGFVGAGPWAVVGPDGALLAMYEAHEGNEGRAKPAVVIPDLAAT
jgi:hypothetical protein